MRTEQQMTDLILQTAINDSRVRAVYLNGSRANPRVKKDRFQDFDVVFVVQNYKEYLRDFCGEALFGASVIAQEPDGPLFADDPDSDPENRYAFMMQFDDGNRIDLSIVRAENFLTHFLSDRLTIPLLDKDSLLPQIPPPTDEAFWVKPPTENELAACENEFWWVSTYVAKGLWRGEILYALDHLNLYVRPQLLKMLSWQAGVLTDFSVSVGKNCKYLDRFLPQETWNALLKTYPPADTAAVWDALFACCSLFLQSHRFVCEAQNILFSPISAEKTLSYLKWVHALPGEEK